MPPLRIAIDPWIGLGVIGSPAICYVSVARGVLGRDPCQAIWLRQANLVNDVNYANGPPPFSFKKCMIGLHSRANKP